MSVLKRLWTIFTWVTQTNFNNMKVIERQNSSAVNFWTHHGSIENILPPFLSYKHTVVWQGIGLSGYWDTNHTTMIMGEICWARGSCDVYVSCLLHHSKDIAVRKTKTLSQFLRHTDVSKIQLTLVSSHDDLLSSPQLLSSLNSQARFPGKIS